MKYFTRRETKQGGEFPESYWTNATDPDGVVRDKTQERERKLQDLQEEIKYVNGLRPGTILDVGCGLGFFLGALPDTWDRHGVDVSKSAIKWAREHIDRAHFYEGTLQEQGFSPGLFDVIFCYHVIEHVDEPVKLIQEINKLMPVGATLVIATPDFDSLCARRFQKNYRMLQDQTHISLFTQESMYRFLRDHGFQVNKVSWPYFATRHATQENLLRMLDPTKISPPFPGNLLSLLHQDPHADERRSALMDDYFLLSCSEDGDVRVQQLTKDDLLAAGEVGLEEFAQELPGSDPMYWGGQSVIIKGRIVVPSAREVVQKWDVE